MKKKWSERFNIKAMQQGKKKNISPLVISAAHSSRLVLQNDNEDSEDDDNGTPDETPNENVDNDETPEENFNNDGAPVDGLDKTFEEVDDVHNEDKSLEDHLLYNECLPSSCGMEITSDRTEDELVSQMKKLSLKQRT